MLEKTVRITVLVAVCACTATATMVSAGALVAPDDPASSLVSWSDSRVLVSRQLNVIGFHSGLPATQENWAESSDRMMWSIVDVEGGLLQYTYRFAGFNKPSVSHFILDLSGACASVSDLGGCFFRPQYKAGSSSWTSASVDFGANGTDPISGGVKFDNRASEADIPYRFLSDRLPAWGDFEMKGGQFLLRNANQGLTSGDHVGYIVVPGTLIYTPGAQNDPFAAPEPGTMLLIGGAFMALGSRRVRNRLSRKH